MMRWALPECLNLRARSRSAPRTQRTLVFAAWTAEERGLLGSEAFGVHPLYRPEKTVADMTLDILQTAGPSRDVVLIGAGQNELEDDLARAAAAQGRTVTPDAKPERGLFYRADHFSLAKRGVPTLLLMAIGGGVDLVSGGRAAGDAWVSDYTAHCYHQTCDCLEPRAGTCVARRRTSTCSIGSDWSWGIRDDGLSGGPHQSSRRSATPVPRHDSKFRGFMQFD